MKLMRNFALPLAALFFGLLLVSQSAHAQVENCPTEPKSNVPIADGEVFIGSNCVLNTAGDVDSFVFSADAGETYQLALALGPAFTTNICLTLYPPVGGQIFSGCTNAVNGDPSVVTDQALTTTGTYTLVVSEPSSGTQAYAVSLERLYPFPPNAKAAKLATVYDGDIAEETDSNAYTFGIVTTGTYQVSATLSGTFIDNLCMTVYLPGGTITGTQQCTNAVNGESTIQVQFTPTQAGTSMAFLSASGNNSNQTYTLEVSCVHGTCTVPPPPPCTLKDALSYNTSTSTLTMNFTVGNIAAVTWNAWLTDQNTMTELFSVVQPITTTAVPITKTTTLSPEGTVGVLSTLTYPTKGIVCSVYTQVSTGTPSAAVK
jgi:hypothetical protein